MGERLIHGDLAGRSGRRHHRHPRTGGMTVVVVAMAATIMLVGAPAAQGLARTGGIASPATTVSGTQATVAPAVTPDGMTVDAAGDVYVSQALDHDVREYTPSGGQITLAFGSIELPDQLAVDSAGDLYAIDGNTNDVDERTKAGTQINLVTSGLITPNGIAVDNAGDVFLTEVTAANVAEVVELVGGGTQTTIPLSGVGNPVGIGVDTAGNLYVADSADNQVVKVAKGGAQTTLAFTGLKGPTQLAVDGAGDVTLADAGNSRVERLTTAGIQSTVGFTGTGAPSYVGLDSAGDVFAFDPTEDDVAVLPASGPQRSLDIGLSHPVGVATDAAGDVFALDDSQDRVVELPAGGGPRVTLPFTGLTAPSAVASDAAGDVYVANGEFPDPVDVLEVPAGGSQVTLASLSGLGGADGIAVDGSGNVYLTQGFPQPKLIEVPTSGTSTGPTITAAFTSLSGVATDSAGDVFVTDDRMNDVIKIAPGGANTVLPFTGLSTPEAIAVDTAGDVIVANAGDDDVVALNKSGTQVTLGTSSLDPTGVAVRNPAGTLGGGDTYVADPSVGIVRFSAGGTPSSPTIGAATPGNSTATVSWHAPAGVGSAITGYAVTPFVNGSIVQPAQTFSGTATSDTITGLTNSTTYTFEVAAINGVGTGSESAASNSVIVGTPLAPTAVIAKPGTTSATVSWTAPAANGSPITGYEITPFIGTTAQVPDTYLLTATSEVVSNLTSGTAYTFEVQALNARGLGGPSVPTAPLTIGAPGAPVLQSAAPGNGTAKVTWYPPAANGAPITGYSITPFAGTAASAPQSFAGSANSDVVTGLTNGTSYTFKILAVNSIGAGPASGATAPIIVGTPSAPVFQSAAPGNAGAVVKWYPPSGNGGALTGYVIIPYVGTVAQTGDAKAFPATSNSDTVSGLTNGTTYTFRIEAENGFGTGPLSGPTAPIVVGTPTAPPAPSTAPGNGTATVAWFSSLANGAPITSYTVTPFVGTTAGTAQTTTTVTTPTSKITFTGLTNGTTYTFEVSARNSFGSGPVSTASASVIVGTPSVPVLQTAIPGNATALVKWYPPGGNGAPITGYTITPYIGTTAQPAQTFNTATNSDTLTGLTDGTAYTFKIAARNSFGTGTTSAATPSIVIGAPVAPAAPLATNDGAGKASLTWTVPVINGSPITHFLVIPYKNGLALTGSTVLAPATTTVFTSLTAGASYTFTVAATNARGTGPQSPLSNAVIAT